MYGWRAKVGVISPMDNMIVEPEFYMFAPPGISVHTSRLSTPELSEMPSAGEDAAAVLGEMGADVITYACNASSFYDGPDGHRSIADRLSEAASVPATTASTAILKALEALDVSQVDVVTPYGSADNERLQTFLEGNGIEIGELSGLGLAADDTTDLAKVNEETAQDTYRRVLNVASDAEGILIVSTNLASAEAIEAMEADTNKPVITVNQAMFWHALRLAGCNARIPGFGSLFDLSQ